jgi:hypothetical protein
MPAQQAEEDQGQQLNLRQDRQQLPHQLLLLHEGFAGVLQEDHTPWVAMNM